MAKLPKLYQGENGYRYAEFQLLKDEYASIGVDIRDGRLNVWSQGQRADHVPVSAKKLRKFARALLALADEVDPPAPKVKYYQGDGFSADSKAFYRVIDESVELFSNRTNAWDKSAWNGDGTSAGFRINRRKIRRRDLPEEAR